ncbi:MAG: hypothetical protein DDT29_01617 [Dehalococcoidia bacterium]|nr:hypothetical protein [Bacillota bacterium]
MRERARTQAKVVLDDTWSQASWLQLVRMFKKHAFSPRCVFFA